MIKITKALSKDNLDNEWSKLDEIHFGKKIEWQEKKFRFKAVENNKLVGMIEGKYEPGVITISTLITVENARGKGVGTTLVKKVEEYGKKNGAHKIWLITGKEWSENIFYQKLGFNLIGSLPDFYLHKDCVIYAKNIK